MSYKMKVVLAGAASILIIILLGWLLDGTPYISLVVVLSVIVWCVFAFLIIKDLIDTVKNFFK